MSTAQKLIPLVNAVHLLDAVLCANCEMISDSNGESCTICGSKSLMNVSRVLGGSAGPLRARAAVVDPGPDQLRNNFTLLVTAESSGHSRRRRTRHRVNEK